MDGPPAQSLGVEPVDARILRAPPRKVTDPIVTRALLTRAVSSAALIMTLTLMVFAKELGKLHLHTLPLKLQNTAANDIFHFPHFLLLLSYSQTMAT